jgi:hypothetical protein
MEIIKILILGTVACICMHSVTFFLNKNGPAQFLVKFKWVIFLLLFIILFLIEDYSNLLSSENTLVISIVNIFIAYSFISGIKKN